MSGAGIDLRVRSCIGYWIFDQFMDRVKEIEDLSFR